MDVDERRGGRTRLALGIGAVAALALVAAGCGGGSEPAGTTGAHGTLPRAVARTHTALLAAADSGDYERLRPLIRTPFSYKHSAAAGGGPIAYWQELERRGGARPIVVLRDLLRLPHTLERGVYVWPFAVAKRRGELTGAERRLLRRVGGEDLSDDFGQGSGYLGWRAGIESDGDWVFFIAGD